MSIRPSVRLQISAMIFLMVQAVLFGAGMVAILLSPLRDQASFYIPLMIATTMVVAAVISWEIAPRFRSRYWRDRGVDHDLISG
jgi:heme A synthase